MTHLASPSTPLPQPYPATRSQMALAHLSGKGAGESVGHILQPRRRAAQQEVLKLPELANLGRYRTREAAVVELEHVQVGEHADLRGETRVERQVATFQRAQVDVVRDVEDLQILKISHLRLGSGLWD